MLLLDLVYLAGMIVLSPWLAWRVVATGRYRRDLAAKLLGRLHFANPTRRPVAWFHAVSVGEVNLLGTLVPAFRHRHPNWLVVVSSTTDTGLDEARRRFANLPIVAWPFDFSRAVGAALDAVNPAIVVLAESELWPNFLRAASLRKVPVVVVNARMSPRSFRRLRWLPPSIRRLLLGQVMRFAVQEREYADRYRLLGVPADRLATTGSVKYDGAGADRDSAKTRTLAQLLACGDGELPHLPKPLVLLAGSTHAPEEAIVLDIFVQLRQRFPSLQLILVPRHPDRFEETAHLIERTGLPFVRRSRIAGPLREPPAIVLLDTIGELGAAWGLADVGFTGGSLDGQRGGQSMIEPAGYGVPCAFGPHVWNFRDAARRLVEAGAAVMVPDAAGLESALATILADGVLRARMGAAARELVRSQQGATSRTLDVIDDAMATGGLTCETTITSR